MGREINRVPMDFDFPLGKSYKQEKWAEHCQSCNKNNSYSRNKFY